MSSQVEVLIDELRIPPEFTRYDSITEADVIARLELWKANAQDALVSLRELVEEQSAAWSLQCLARVTAVAAAFNNHGPWVTDKSREVSKDILASLSEGHAPVLEEILRTIIQPLFRSNPHPSLDLFTGRKLSRLAGGPLASQDLYQNQTWKSIPGSADVVSWCVRTMNSKAYELFWHLIIPPVMTLLDDYEAVYKLCGVRLVSQMLERVPAELLRRTGIDGLLLSSLNTCLNHLHNPETPNLLRAAITTLGTLIELTTPPGSAQRFDQLCVVLGDYVIGGVWIYASSEMDTILATVEVLPTLVRGLGLGCARYLKALIPQLVHPLLPNPFNPPQAELQLFSACALGVVIDTCSVRMHRWKGSIIEGVGKCWAMLADSGGDDESSRELQRALQAVAEKLARACPSVVQDEYARLLSADSKLFLGLVPSDLDLGPSSGRLCAAETIDRQSQVPVQHTA